jgi:alpha-methylacyl-CoA racemase
MENPGVSGEKGPLTGIKIVEMAGLGPVPLAGLLLAEMGAEVVRVERLAESRSFMNVPATYDLDRHGRKIVRIDLKRAEGIELLLDMIAGSDGLIEGFRPGVMERLGVGPDVALKRNPQLVYGRMTGFGQQGPLSTYAGHDLTYLAYCGALHAIGPRDGKPVPPLNLVADSGGGTMFLAAGVLAGLLQVSRSGKGQVVDVSMLDGVSFLLAPFYSFLASGMWKDRRGSNLVDSGSPFYNTYETADGGHVAVACLEPQFFAEFARLLPLGEPLASGQYDETLWPAMEAEIAVKFLTKSRDEWALLFEPTDACVAPVLSLTEAPTHPHNRFRRSHVQQDGFLRPAPAPRFSGTPSVVSEASVDTSNAPAALALFGISEERSGKLEDLGIIGS